MEASAILGEQVYVAVTWKGTGGYHQEGSQSSGVGQVLKDGLTLLHAGPRQGVLTHKVISGCPIVILDHKTQQGQFRHQDPEA